MFHHLLITRFNLKNPGWEVTKNNETLLNEEWMTERIFLFENYCLPSIVNQTNQNFTWLLFFDVTTEEKYKLQINDLVKNHANIVVLYINGMPLFTESIRNYISAKASDTPYLITSMIDNDDCVNKSYIAEVQARFNNQDFMAVDFIEGYTLQIEPQIMLGKKEHIFNPFISLIEKNDHPKTVWHYEHNLWKKEPRIIQVSGKRIWMSIIHGKNKVNEFDGYGNIDWKKISTDFIVSDKINAKIEANLLPFSQWWFTSLKNFLYVKMVLFSKVLKRSLGIYKLKK